MKKKCCIINALLAFAIFCIMFGNVCFVWGESAANSKEMSGGIFLSAYYFLLLIIAVVLVHSLHLSAKPFIFASVYSSALMIIVWLVALITWPGRKADGNEFISDGFIAVAVFITITVLSLIMSAIYLFAAWKKEK